MPDTKLALEDLRVGQTFVSGTHRVEADDIKRFAAEYDPQPFHLDDEAARDSLFGGLAASGWHTAAITMKLLVGSGLPLEGGIIGSGGELLWLRPVRPGDVLRVETKIQEITPSRSKLDRGAVQVHFVTRNQAGEPVLSFSPKLVVMRRRQPG